MSERKDEGIAVRTITVGRQSLQVATTHGPNSRPPLLLFNGIGANWQLAKPFLQALTRGERAVRANVGDELPGRCIGDNGRLSFDRYRFGLRGRHRADVDQILVHLKEGVFAFAVML